MSLAHRVAMESPHITAVCIEATECPDLVRQYRVTGVPKTVITTAHGEREILGAVPESDFIQQVVQAAAREA